MGARRITIFDCEGSERLPGKKVSAADITDPAVARVRTQTSELLRFYSDIFSRNSIDDEGCDVSSSVHYSRGYCNAAWNGQRMIYGDGDGYLFTEFTTSSDFIGHELAHGVTEYAAGIGYKDEYGALNESLSDVFGSIFRQWLNGETSVTAAWKIGPDLIAPAGQALGWLCIRDMADPASAHCVAPQVSNYAQYIPGGDPHDNSGIPNYAFYRAAMAVGGHVWETVGKAWYATLVSGDVRERPSFTQFADSTVREARRLFPHADVANKIAMGWEAAGISLGR